MSHFRYPCPGCRSRSDLHDPDCQFAGTSRAEIENAYIDVLAVLSVEPRDLAGLREAVDGEWTPLHDGVRAQLSQQQRLREEDGVYELLTPDERAERVSTPSYEPLRTIYEEGSSPGCHDHAVFAMIAYYEMVGLSWPETRENVTDWLRESGSWGRGGFEEASPEELVQKKRHVYESGYGWKQAAREAKAVIDRRVN